MPRTGAAQPSALCPPAATRRNRRRQGKLSGPPLRRPRNHPGTTPQNLLPTVGSFAGTPGGRNSARLRWFQPSSSPTKSSAYGRISCGDPSMKNSAHSSRFCSPSGAIGLAPQGFGQSRVGGCLRVRVGLVVAAWCCVWLAGWGGCGSVDPWGWDAGWGVGGVFLGPGQAINATRLGA
jgi:hypothetical protein